MNAKMPPRTTRRTYRLHERDSLDLYVFADEVHARSWLMQPIIDRDRIKVEPVEVGPMTRCARCGGQGWHQKVTSIGRAISANEFLFGAPQHA